MNQERNKNQKSTKKKRKNKVYNMDQNPSSNDKNQEPRTMVLRPLENNQGLRIQGPKSSR